MRLNASQSLFASHGGGIAALNGCTNGWRSVLERSCFSYQVAAGSTTSEYRHDPFIRKSIVVNRSSLPVGASSCHSTSFGRWSAGVSLDRTAASGTPST